MNSEYIEKTRPMVNFLTSCLDIDKEMQTIIAQANGNTEKLIDMLWIVKCQCEEWIKELIAMEG